MNIKTYTLKGTKCDLMSIGAVCFFSYIFYQEANRFWSSYKEGTIVFRYHSNLFYGIEAVVMYVSFSIIMLLLLIATVFSIRKCYKKVENNTIKEKKI